jgi:hypothetical protein
MDVRMHRLAWLVAPAFVTGALLAACGGGALLVLGFIGSAGGDWVQDDQPAVDGLQIRKTCGDGNAECRINIQPAGGLNLYAANFDLTFTSNLPNCVASGTGQARSERLELTGCFSGRYVNINQAVSDNGAVRMFFDVDENDLQVWQGVWVELQQGTRRFVFRNDGQETLVNGVRVVSNTGCEIGSPNTPLNIGLSMSDIRDAAGPFETTIASLSIGGGAPYSGKFVGVSGMRLTRGTEVLELQRQQGSAGC